VLRKLYADRGFRFRHHTYGALMVKPLTRAPFRSTFGPRFFWTVVDQF
jgi:hypothetical protein